MDNRREQQCHCEERCAISSGPLGGKTNLATLCERPSCLANPPSSPNPALTTRVGARRGQTCELSPRPSTRHPLSKAAGARGAEALCREAIMGNIPRSIRRSIMKHCNFPEPEMARVLRVPKQPRERRTKTEEERGREREREREGERERERERERETCACLLVCSPHQVITVIDGGLCARS